VKTRIVSGRQHLLRVDVDARTAIPEKVSAEIAADLRAAISKFDAVLLSDYGKGVLTGNVCAAAIEAAGGKPVLVDPKGLDWQRFRNATVLKPNLREAAAFLDSAAPNEAAKNSDEMARSVRQICGTKNVLLTRAADGVTLSCADGSALSFPARASEVQDEAGAGDVVAAVTTLALAAGADLQIAAWLGNVAAGAKVAKFGTHAVSDFEILEALGERFT
jgi:D-beta-D-heptose 7-phosphate kinase/D-beta-D-heptose 1-phosphate adenosyltransferase